MTNSQKKVINKVIKRLKENYMEEVYKIQWSIEKMEGSRDISLNLIIKTYDGFMLPKYELVFISNYGKISCFNDNIDTVEGFENVMTCIL